MKCKYIFPTNKFCVNESINKKNFCKNHMYYENKVDPLDLKWCDKHKFNILVFDDDKQYYCKFCMLTNNKNKKICEGLTNKGNKCKYQSLENDNYCEQHQNYKKWKNLTHNSGKKICINWIRGCWSELNDDFSRCLECRKKESIKDKKLREIKKKCAINYNLKHSDTRMCKDCNSITKSLINQSCLKCYKMKYTNNKNRLPKNIYLTRLDNYKKGAKYRNLEWKLEDDEAISFMSKKCFYCNDSEDINGIDRIDSAKGYFIENCVSCCFQCNSMKSIKNLTDFYKICEHIVTYNKIFNGKLYTESLFKKSENSTFNKYKYSAKKRGIDFNINNKTVLELFSLKCTYCGNFEEEGCNGIDRIDSKKSYTNINCVPCCYTCNVMKLDFSENFFLQKCLAITCKKNGIDYKLESSLEKEKMIKMFENIKYLKETDNNDFEFINESNYYKNLIWNGNLNELKKIKINIEFVSSKESMDIWYYFRNNISSLAFQKNSHLAGRQIYILVKDDITKKYLGIMSLNSDILNLEHRDIFIGWNYNERIKNKKIDYIMNLSTCVPLQPFGFNFTGGKLLTKLIFSKEVLEEFKKKYKQNLLGITTTGVYGKSIQYDRLKEIKFVGYTKGFSTFKIPVEVINKCRQYLIKKDIKYKRKLHIVTKVLSDLGLNKNDYILDNMKGIYFGFCHPDANKFLKGEINELSNYTPNNADRIFNEWLDRWAIKRYNHLEKNNRLNLKSNPINLFFDKENNEKKIKNKEYFKKYYQDKKNKELENIKVSDDILILPKNFTIFVDDKIQYIQFQKSIKEKRITAKNKILSNDIQSEINKLIEEKIKIKYPDIVNQNIIVINPKLFVLLNDTIKEQNNDNDIPKPKLPDNFSITTILGKDKIQFSKKINDIRIQEQKIIKSYDLQSELNNFISFLNEKYEINIQPQLVNNSNNWKTTNKIITKKEEKDTSRQIKYIEKKKAEIGEEAFRKIKAQQAKERRGKKENKDIEL